MIKKDDGRESFWDEMEDDLRVAASEYEKAYEAKVSADLNLKRAQERVIEAQMAMEDCIYELLPPNLPLERGAAVREGADA